jgi:nanoRNase/pAp phosphatase (c-di-AMP/oligoRNAs hydrolase)
MAKLRIQAKRFLSMVGGLKPRKIAFLCHHNADPDAVCSAFALMRLLSKSFRLRATIASPTGASKLSRKVSSELGFAVEPSLATEEWGAFVLVDTNTLSQLKEWGEQVRASGKPVAIVDHHTRHPDSSEMVDINICVEDSTSTSEVVFMIAEAASLKIDRLSAQALMVGLAYDTRHFTYARSETIRIAAHLVERGADVEKALTTLQSRMERSERMARLKAGQRAEMHRIGKWLVVFSNLSSYQASAARALIGMGADLAAVGGGKKGELRISLRSTKEFLEETQIHLGKDLARPVAEMVGGKGGGHSTAAGVTGTGDAANITRRILEILHEKLRPKE